MIFKKFSEKSVKDYCSVMMIGMIIGLAFFIIAIVLKINKIGLFIEEKTVFNIEKFFSLKGDVFFNLVGIGMVIILLLPILGTGYLGARALKEGMKIYFYLAVFLIIYIIIGTLISLW